ncbi:MAG: T9SS type A sorting domain-containing protein, partial [Bacteroidetes bacterium]
SQDNEKAFLEKAKTDLIADFKKGQNEFWIMLNEQADVSGAKYLPAKDEKGEYVFNLLTETAIRTQNIFLPILNSKADSYQQFWIANTIFVKGDIELAKEIAAFNEVKELLPNTRMKMLEPMDVVPDPLIAKKDATLMAIEWGISKTNAPQVWALGYKGQGVVIGGQDTGVEWDHIAIQEQYRGWNGIVGDHNYNWHDAIHSGGGGSCGVNATSPCDDHNHGTHTIGTIVGDDLLGNQIGMAPSAKWIGARNMDVGAGTPTTYIECFQWFLAPTNIANQSPMPSKAPHVINNSWGCDAAEGCNSGNYSNMEIAITNLRAAGVVVVASAGNDGPGCNTVNGPPAHFAGSFTVGSTTSTDAMSNFSSRGNINIDGSGRIKPNVSAPGSNVRSCIKNGTYSTFSGTSMAGPHVVGAVALLISAVPSLAGQVDTIESILEKTCVKITSTQTCNGTAPSTYPNNTVGHGRIDILAAVNYALSSASTSEQHPYGKGITVFPTPAKDKLFFRFENFRDFHAEVKLINITGQVVFEQKTRTQNNALEISIDALPKGFYMYSIKTGGTGFHGKFIKE